MSPHHVPSGSGGCTVLPGPFSWWPFLANPCAWVLGQALSVAGTPPVPDFRARGRALAPAEVVRISEVESRAAKDNEASSRFTLHVEPDRTAVPVGQPSSQSLQHRLVSRWRSWE